MMARDPPVKLQSLVILHPICTPYNSVFTAFKLNMGLECLEALARRVVP
ncbi:hypothetical protein HanXRQr2_Chr12g0550681 [Helianthus annuus]|uniref:Uncharacterized protein n=1 Tax=Helianthus annuus TaxID=4232 RepID=A0A9K3HI21_HELAN|nr:hypothetical protein HanXRQr2_Chr12g0550681 [Helianthus annuus]KAJ0863455.1 hypothetical protein HanPSC8_Chr12g0530211 [Helianthus annuus]